MQSLWCPSLKASKCSLVSLPVRLRLSIGIVHAAHGQRIEGHHRRTPQVIQSECGVR